MRIFLANTLFILSLCSTATASTYIKSLTDASTVPLESFYQKPTLAIVFQENCSACQQQMKDLSCLDKDLEIILLGAFNDEKALKRDYIKSKTSYKAYYASEDILKELKIKNSLTPQIIYLSKNSPKTFLGYKACTEIKKLIGF